MVQHDESVGLGCAAGCSRSRPPDLPRARLDAAPPRPPALARDDINALNRIRALAAA
jgi:hypothetical protein